MKDLIDLSYKKKELLSQLSNIESEIEVIESRQKGIKSYVYKDELYLTPAHFNMTCGHLRQGYVVNTTYCFSSYCKKYRISLKDYIKISPHRKAYSRKVYFKVVENLYAECTLDKQGRHDIRRSLNRLQATHTFSPSNVSRCTFTP